MSRTHIYREMSALEIVDPMLETVVIRGGHIDRKAFHAVTSYFMKPPAPSGSCRDRETRAIYTMRAGRTNREEILSSYGNTVVAHTLHVRSAIEGNGKYISNFRGTATHRHVIGMLTPTDRVCSADTVHIQTASTAYANSRINIASQILSVTSLLDLLRDSYNRPIYKIPDLFLFPERTKIIKTLAGAPESCRTPDAILRDLARMRIPDEAYMESTMIVTYTRGGVAIHPRSAERSR